MLTDVDDYVVLANATILRLDQENQRLGGALRNCLLLAMRNAHRKDCIQKLDWEHVIRFCKQGGVEPPPLRDADQPGGDL